MNGERPEYVGFDRAALDAAHARVAAQVDATGAPPRRDLVGGLDCAYPPGRVVAAAVVLDAATLKVAAQATAVLPRTVPYVPGYLFARELPALLAVLEALDHPAAGDIPWLVDGHGILHPGGSGVANHVGVEAGVHAIGVAKKPLRLGRRVPALAPGEAEPLRRDGRLVGYALRSTRRATRPIFVSPGHRVSPEVALDIVRPLCRFKLPEPVRAADALAAEARSAPRE